MKKVAIKVAINTLIFLTINTTINIIGSLDEKIEKNAEMIEEITSYMKLFHTQYKQNYEFKNINILEIAEIKYGKGIPTSIINKTGKYSVYGSNGIIGYLESYIFEDCKIAISCRGNSSGVIHLTKPYSTITSNSLFLNFINNYTYYFYLEFKDTGLSEYRTGSAQPQITIEDLSKLNLTIPIDIEKHNSKVKPLFEYILKLQVENFKISQLKQLYLQKFFD